MYFWIFTSDKRRKIDRFNIHYDEVPNFDSNTPAVKIERYARSIAPRYRRKLITICFEADDGCLRLALCSRMIGSDIYNEVDSWIESWNKAVLNNASLPYHRDTFAYTGDLLR